MKVIAKSTIKHNGQYFTEGDVLPDMTETQLSKLVAANVVIVKDGTVAPAKPTDANLTPPDKHLETKETEAVANLPISMNLSKEKLIGIARANGLKVEKTTNRPEVYKMIKEYREANGIKVEDVEPANKPEDTKAKEAKAAAEKLEAEEKAAAEAEAKAAKDATPPGADSKPEDKKDEGEDTTPKTPAK